MSADTKSPKDENKRDFLELTVASFAAVGAGSVAWPLVNSMNPAADTVALSTTEVDLSPIQVGQAITVFWQGKPVFIRRRTADEITEAGTVETADLPDSETDKDRVKKDEWLVVVGICTHLGCVPVGQKPSQARGEYGGWFCPCHGSHYDTSGRIRKGPAPENLPVPVATFIDETTIKLG